MWNSLDLQNPSKDVVEYRPQDTSQIESLRDFATVLTTAADLLTSDDPLWKEMQVFRNIQAKYRRILHCDKCLVYLHRVSHCLKKMVLLNLSKSYLDLAERFLISYHDSTENLRLPSRQQVEFVLIRSQGAAKLVGEAIKYTKETFCFLVQKLKIGHLILDLIMATSVTARLHVMFKAILVKLCMTYQKVLSWVYKVKKGDHKWPEKVNLPLDLEKWLTESESELMRPFPMSEDDAVMLKKLVKAKAKAKEIESDADSVTIIESPEEDTECMVVEEKEEDYGEVISREEVNQQSNYSKRQKLTLKKLLSAASIEDLEKIWTNIISSDKDLLPITLTAKKKRIIGKFLTRVKGNLEKPAKKKKKTDFSFHTAMLAKYLGFTQEQIESSIKPRRAKLQQPEALELQPVKTIKKLKVLYKNICKNLTLSNKVVKCQRIQKVFRQRICDIKLLKENGDKMVLKKLIFCTSKVILTLYEQ